MSKVQDLQKFTRKFSGFAFNVSKPMICFGDDEIKVVGKAKFVVKDYTEISDQIRAL